MEGVDTAPEMERMTDMRVYADQAATTSLSKTCLLYTSNGNISVKFKFADELRKIAEYIEINTTEDTTVAG